MENMNTEQGTRAENMGNDAAVQEISQEAGKEQKLFTQDEVNGFIQSRLGRMKEQAAKEAKVEYDQKLADLQSREMKLMIKEKISERGMPKELADIISCTDENDLNSKLDILDKLYNKGSDNVKSEDEEPKGFYTYDPVTGERKQITSFGPRQQSSMFQIEDPIRTAMKLGRKD